MLEFDGLIGLLLIGLWLYCIFDAITSPPQEIRNLPKAAWIGIVLILPEIGSILWLLAGRPTTAGRAGGLPYKGNSGPKLPVRRPAPARATAPDDDPDFLRQLKKSNDDHESMLNQWEADLRRREQEMRNRGDVPPES